MNEILTHDKIVCVVAEKSWETVSSPNVIGLICSVLHSDFFKFRSEPLKFRLVTVLEGENIFSAFFSFKICTIVKPLPSQTFYVPMPSRSKNIRSRYLHYIPRLI